jgi:ABC-type multidrug transport system ATPase subunit
MDTTLTADHVQKKFASRLALQDTSLQLHRGEILALLGPNGAGKTTLIKILATLLNKDAGQVEIFGYDLDRHAETIRHLVGYVGQDTERSAYARLTVWENLQFFGALRGMSNRQVETQASRLVEYFDFHGQMERLFGGLSGGQKQTVMILRALLHDPPLIFLDEPTRGLDPIIGRRIRSFLKAYVHEQGKSLLLTSHVLSEVDELADRVALIQGGRIHASGTPQSLKDALGAREFVELEKNRLPEPVLERLLRLPVVRCQMEREPGWVSLGVTDAMAGAAAIIQVLRGEQVQASFRHHSATLEDAFVHHIGVLQERFDA